MTSPHVAKKRVRAKRARARQRERRGLDLRPHYREADLPAASNLGIVTIEDPYQPAGRIDKFGNLVVEAQLEPVRHADGSLSEGAPAWTPPTRPPLTAIINVRQDPIGRLYARHKIDEAQYAAARGYQRLHETATVGNLSPAAMRPRVDGGRIPDPVSDVRMAAARRLRSVESTVREWHGTTGLGLVRVVLTGGRGVEAAARDFGARSTREVLSWGWLFRQCLNCLCRALGLANTARQPRPPPSPRRNGDATEPDLYDPKLHAGRDELSEPQLRRGRPLKNGAGA